MNEDWKLILKLNSCNVPIEIGKTFALNVSVMIYKMGPIMQKHNLLIVPFSCYYPVLLSFLFENLIKVVRYNMTIMLLTCERALN